MFLCCCFCLGESFAQCSEALGSVGVHVSLTSLTSFDYKKAMPACAAACYPGAKLARLGSVNFCLCIDKKVLYELLGLSAILILIFA